MKLRLAGGVYGYMRGEIFKVLGVGILIFELLLIIMFVVLIPRTGMSARSIFEVQLLFSGFLFLSTVIAVGLIRLHRWAAVTASALGLVWSLALAVSLGYRPWESLFVGLPIVFGMLLPLYATVRNWSSLKTLSDLGFKPFFDALQSSDRLHLE